MQPNLIVHLRCPHCGGGLHLERTFAYATQGADSSVEQGLTACTQCRRSYPVINGIPRILPDNFIGNLRRYHADFAQTYGVTLRGEAAPADPRERALQRTLESFSYQWNTFNRMHQDWRANFLDYMAPLDASFLAGKFGLDAGCGFGRHTHWAAKLGARMCGLDLSDAVESARANTAGLRVDIVQGDIMNPPFRPASFDFFYSLGVLHHLPEPEAGFRALTPLLKEGGLAAIWIYGPRRGLSEAVTVPLRRLMPHLPFRARHAISWTVAAGLRLVSHWPGKALRLLGADQLADRLPIPRHAGYPFDVVVADAFDRLSVPLVQYYGEADLRGWFERAGYSEIQSSRRFANNESWRVRGCHQHAAVPAAQANYISPAWR